MFVIRKFYWSNQNQKSANWFGVISAHLQFKQSQSLSLSFKLLRLGGKGDFQGNRNQQCSQKLIGKQLVIWWVGSSIKPQPAFPAQYFSDSWTPLLLLSFFSFIKYKTASIQHCKVPISTNIYEQEYTWIPDRSHSPFF